MSFSSNSTFTARGKQTEFHLKTKNRSLDNYKKYVTSMS